MQATITVVDSQDGQNVVKRSSRSGYAKIFEGYHYGNGNPQRFDTGILIISVLSIHCCELAMKPGYWVFDRTVQSLHSCQAWCDTLPTCQGKLLGVKPLLN